MTRNLMDIVASSLPVGYAGSIGSTGYTGSQGTGTGSGDITIGTSNILSGTTTRVLYNNAGKAGEYTVTGTGSVALSDKPTFTTGVGINTAPGTNELRVSGNIDTDYNTYITGNNPATANATNILVLASATATPATTSAAYTTAGNFSSTNSSSSPSITGGLKGLEASASNNAIANTLSNAYGAYIGGYNTKAGLVTNLFGVYGRVDNATGSGLVSNAYAISAAVTGPATITTAYALKAAIGDTGTITTGYGLYSDITNANVSTGYGIYIGTISSTTKWGLYQNDANSNNYFAGSLGVGSIATSDLRLHSSISNTDPATAKYNGYFDGGIVLSLGNNLNTFSNVYSAPTINQSSRNATASLITGGALRGYHAVVKATGTPGTVTAIGGYLADVQNTGTGTLTNGYGFQALVQNTGVGTLTNGYGFQALGATNSGGGTFSTYYGFYMGTSTGATSNYGFYSNIASASGAYNFYAAGTAANYFAGATTFAAAITYAGTTLTYGTAGTGKMVLDTAPQFTNGIGINVPAGSYQIYSSGATDTAYNTYVTGTNTATSGSPTLIRGEHTSTPASASAAASYAAYFNMSATGSIAITGELDGIYASAYNSITSANVATMYGGYITAYNTGNSGTVGSMTAVYARVDNAPLAGTVTSAYGVRSAMTNATGNVITNAYGFYSDMDNAKIATGYGLYIGTLKGTVAKWGIYQSDDTAKNYFNGIVGIGTSGPVRDLDILGPTLTANTQSTYALGVANLGGTLGDLTFGSNSTDTFIQSWASKPLNINGQGNTIVLGAALKYGNVLLANSVAGNAGGSLVSSDTPTITSPIIASTTWASKPAAGTAGKMIFVSNAGTKGSMWLDDGTRWKPLNGVVTLATLDSSSSNIGNTETIVLKYQIPAGMWQVGDRIRIYNTFTKSVTADTGVLSFRIGTAGTVAGDTTLLSATVMGSGTQQYASVFDIRLESVTSAILLSNNAGGYGSYATSNTPPTAVTIANTSSNAVWIDISIYANTTGATTVQMVDAQIQLISKAN